jgi:hypothetical protein
MTSLARDSQYFNTLCTNPNQKPILMTFPKGSLDDFFEKTPTNVFRTIRYRNAVSILSRTGTKNFHRWNHNFVSLLGEFMVLLSPIKS